MDGDHISGEEASTTPGSNDFGTTSLMGSARNGRTFFVDLEIHHRLNPRLRAHLWLLHHLFLHSINQDAQDWANGWNSHKLEVKRQGSFTPRDMFTFSMICNGPRGLVRSQEPVDDAVEDPESYGIDWDVAEDSRLMSHFLEHNDDEGADDSNPFSVGPSSLSDVPCHPPDCPLTPAELVLLDAGVSNQSGFSLASRSMDIRRRVWAVGLASCNHIIRSRPPPQ